MTEFNLSEKREELSNKEVERYFKVHNGLIFNWGKCHGKEAYPEEIKEDLGGENENN
ncbi:MAG: hypothetical protein ACOC1O_02200 [bacterium]